MRTMNITHFITFVLIIGTTIVFPVFSDQSIDYAEGACDISLADVELNMYTVKAKDDYFMDSGESLARKLVAYTNTPIVINDLLFSGEDRQISITSSEDSSASLEMNLDVGEIMVNSGYAGYFDGHGDTPNLLKKANVKKTVRGHLKNLGLFPGKDVIGSAEVQEIRLGIAEKDGATYDYCKLQYVRYERVIDGLPVEGASRIIARLAEGGRLHSLVYRWMEVKKAPLKINPELLDSNNIIAKAEARIREMVKDAQKICVQSMDLVLYDDGEQYIEPAIRVIANLTIDGLEQDVPLDFYIPVAKKSKANFPFKQDAAVPAPGVE